MRQWTIGPSNYVEQGKVKLQGRTITGGDLGQCACLRHGHDPRAGRAMGVVGVSIKMRLTVQ